MFAILCISACNFLSFVRTLPKLFVIFWKFLSEAKLNASGEKNERNKDECICNSEQGASQGEIDYEAFALNKVRFDWVHKQIGRSC